MNSSSALLLMCVSILVAAVIIAAVLYRIADIMELDIDEGVAAQIKREVHALGDEIDDISETFSRRAKRDDMRARREGGEHRIRSNDDPAVRLSRMIAERTKMLGDRRDGPV